MNAPVVVPSRFKVARLLSYGALKRSFDVAVSSMLLVGLSPLFATVAIAIKLDSPGPVFFRQKRTGKNGKEFEILKFRSMVADNDMRDASCEDEYTKLGKRLRKTSIDELPQLINILKGEMSFIGPRPERPEIIKQYQEDMPEFVFRTKVKAGLAGYAQVYGKYNTTPYDKLKLDLFYIENLN